MVILVLVTSIFMATQNSITTVNVPSMEICQQLLKEAERKIDVPRMSVKGFCLESK